MSSMSFSNDAYPRQSRPFMSFWEIGTDKGIFGLRGIFPYHVYDTGKTGLAFSDRSALTPFAVDLRSMTRYSSNRKVKMFPFPVRNGK